MFAIKLNIALVSCLIFLSGCSNTLYFYETDKVSLTVEARPDSTQPVQGSLGINQRVALVVPKTKENGDALSALSAFNFKITEKKLAFNPVLIQTAFITGKAANSIKKEEIEVVTKAIMPDSVEVKALSEHADCIISESKKQDEKLITLKEIADHEYSRLSDDDWEKFKPIVVPCGFLDRQNYSANIHKLLQIKLDKL